jgi:hypothetical protein
VYKNAQQRTEIERELEIALFGQQDDFLGGRVAFHHLPDLLEALFRSHS